MGRITVQFTITDMGQVIASRTQQTTVSNPVVERCIRAAKRRWEFPKPEGGGFVLVTYPFMLQSAGRAALN